MLRIALAAAGTLVLPLTLLLFAQWPLRDAVQAGSRQANDLAQVIFALYVAVAVTAASIHGAHLSAHTHDAPPDARWKQWGTFACTAPWAVFLLWTSASTVWRSVAQLERFGETLNPGYFLIRVALWLMALLVLVYGVVSLRKPA